MSGVKVLFVCLGNICRSPTAHGLFEDLVNKNNLGDCIHIDSAGTGDWHVGKPPDKRAQSAALERGYDISGLRARVVNSQDFQNYDYLLAMDRDNFANLKAMQPMEFEGHLGLFLEFGDQQDYLEVPDPYYGGEAGFQLVLDLIENAAEGLLTHIRRQHLE